MKTAEVIAYKYVHGLHDALTDKQEIMDMTQDIMKYAEEMVKHNLKIAAENAELDIDYIFDGEDERKTCLGIDKYSILGIKIELL